MLLTCLLRAYPDIRGVLFELPAVIERTVIPQDVADRIECVAGDALTAVPAKADAYVFSTVLRCFDDRQCVALLTACRQSMHDNSRLLALEMVIPPDPPSPYEGSPTFRHSLPMAAVTETRKPGYNSRHKPTCISKASGLRTVPTPGSPQRAPDTIVAKRTVIRRAASPATTAGRSKHVLFRIASQTRAPPSEAVDLGDETRSGRVLLSQRGRARPRACS